MRRADWGSTVKQRAKGTVAFLRRGKVRVSSVAKADREEPARYDERAVFSRLSNKSPSRGIQLAGWLCNRPIPVLRDPRRAVQHAVLLAFDDSFLLDDLAGSHIRALRNARWTYAVYYGPRGGPFEYELYDNEADPGQLRNLTKYLSGPSEHVWRSLHHRLVAKMIQVNAAPSGFSFPTRPL